MGKEGSRKSVSASYWIFAGAVLLILIGFGIVMLSINQSLLSQSETGDALDALATSKDDCVTCHRDETPGIVQQYSYSTMAAAEVSCRDCHDGDHCHVVGDGFHGRRNSAL